MTRLARLSSVFVTGALALIGPGSIPSNAAASQGTAKANMFAQQLVEATQATHPEADEIGISAVASHGCRTIASTDPGDIGEACEKDDSEPMRTGKPFVEKEKDGFDISVPLHDSNGKLVGSVGIGFKPRAGQTEAALVDLARKIAGEMEAQISSKSTLFERAR
jgi:hypothetical protein